MTTADSAEKKASSRPAEESGTLFPAFPESRDHALQWDGEALGQPPTGMKVVKPKGQKQAKA